MSTNAMTRVAIVGIGGRMCGRIAHLIQASDDLDIVGGVEAQGHPAVGRDVGELSGSAHTGHHVVDVEVQRPFFRGDDDAILCPVN